MNEQPTALRLADALEVDKWHISGVTAQSAADELRRLHDLCAEWEKKAATWLASPEAAKRLDGYREVFQRVDTLEYALRQALEALEQYTHVVTSTNDPHNWVSVTDGGKPAREAITAAKQALGAFYVSNTVYECKLKEKNT
jgi:hypothetical protein